MKRIVLAAVTCLSLLIAIPAVSAAHSSGHDAARHHRPDDRGGQQHRAGDHVTSATRVSCEGMDRDSSSRDGGSSGSGDNGDRRDDGDHGDRHNDLSCKAMLDRRGTRVRDAKLRVVHGAAVWEEVELGV